MRYKALSDDYGRNAKKWYYLSYGIGFLLVAILAILFYRQIRKPDFDPISIIWILMPYSAFSIPNSILLVICAAKKNIIDLIGRNRYITINKSELILEDNIDDRSLERTYAWKEFKCIKVSNVTPFNGFNKNKTYTITFIVNQDEYDRYFTPKFRQIKHIDCIASFFTVMHQQDIMDDIEKYWQGSVEYLSNKIK